MALCKHGSIEVDRRPHSENWLKWSWRWQNGCAEDRVTALYGLSMSMNATFKTVDVVAALGLPARRASSRFATADGSCEVLDWKHPLDASVTIRVRLVASVFESLLFIVDEGAHLEPSVLSPVEFWHSDATDETEVHEPIAESGPRWTPRATSRVARATLLAERPTPTTRAG